MSGAERFGRDAELSRALLGIARHADSRMCVILLGTILENPGLAERLLEVLGKRQGNGADGLPGAAEQRAGAGRERRRT